MKDTNHKFQYHHIILDALEYSGDRVIMHDDTHDIWLKGGDLRHLATQACEAVYESMCSDAVLPWRGYCRISCARREQLGGKWYQVITFEPDSNVGLPRLTAYIP